LNLKHRIQYETWGAESQSKLKPKLPIRQNTNTMVLSYSQSCLPIWSRFCE